MPNDSLEEVERLRDAIRKHRDQRIEDLEAALDDLVRVVQAFVASDDAARDWFQSNAPWGAALAGVMAADVMTQRATRRREMQAAALVWQAVHLTDDRTEKGGP